MAVSIVADRRFQAHEPGDYHPESPARLVAIDEALSGSSVERVEVEPRSASAEEVLFAHTESHVERLEEARGQHHDFDGDTHGSPASVETALLAAGSSIDLAEGVARGGLSPGFALVRPPGHHATADRCMGFCLINNVAVAASALRARGLAERIAIYDFDVHHGNGTEAIFWEDPNVLYMSTHQWPFYPGTGSRSAVGGGKGEGTTLNVPMPAGTGNTDLLQVTDELLAPRVRAFRPDVILLSAGFDPFVDDPLGGFVVTEDGFVDLARRWRDLADEVSEGRIAGVLEGGYDLPGLGRCVRAVVDSWA